MLLLFGHLFHGTLCRSCGYVLFLYLFYFDYFRFIRNVIVRLQMYTSIQCSDPITQTRSEQIIVTQMKYSFNNIANGYLLTHQTIFTICYHYATQIQHSLFFSHPQFIIYIALVLFDFCASNNSNFFHYYTLHCI